MLIWKKEKIIKHKKLLSHIKVSKEILTFGNIEIEKDNYYRNKTPIFLKDVDILVKNIDSFWRKKNFKYLIGYLCNDHKVKTLHIILPKTSTDVRSFDGQTKWCIFWLKMMTY